MGRRTWQGAVRITEARVRKGRFDWPLHAYEEMVDEDVTDVEVEGAILAGKLAAWLTEDPRGARFVFRGPASDGSPPGVVCRLQKDKVRIVTVFRIG